MFCELSAMSVNVCGLESSNGSFRTPLRRKVRGWLLAGAQVGEGCGDPRFRLSYDRKPRGSTADWPDSPTRGKLMRGADICPPGICPPGNHRRRHPPGWCYG